MKGLLFTYALTYGGALAALWNPFWGLLAYVCFAIVKPDFMWFWSVPQGHYSRILAIAMLLGWAIHGFGRWEFGRGKAIVLAFVGFWGWAAISGFVAPHQPVAWNYLESMGKILLPFLVGVTVIDSVAKLKTLAWVLMLSQGYVALEMNLSYYSGYNRLFFQGFAGLDNNGVAASMVVGVGLALFLGLNAPRLWQKGVAFLAAILMAHAVMFSFSRGGLLALVVTIMVAGFVIRREPRHLLPFGAMVFVGLILAGPSVVEEFSTVFTDAAERDVSATSRLDLWADCWDVMQRNPLLGVGPDHWPLIAHEYGWPRGKEAHSLWFQTGAELGFPGLMFLGAFFGVCILRLWSMAREGRNSPEPGLEDEAGMVIASLAGFLVAAQFLSLESIEVPYYVALIGVGVLKLSAQAVDALEEASQRGGLHLVTAETGLR